MASVSDAAEADPSRRQVVLAVLAGAFATLIWASWIVATRHAVTTELDAVATGFVRYIVPAIVFLPWWLRYGLLPRGVPIWKLAIVVVGTGFGVHMFSALGMQYAPVAHFGALAPGSIPLYVALYMFVFAGERLAWPRLVGLALIFAAMMILAGESLIGDFSQSWRGDLFFIGTAVVWAGYTVLFRQLGLPTFVVAGLVGVWSSVFFAPLAAWRGFSVLAAAPLQDVLTQLLVQGFLTNVVAFVAFGYSLTVLGAARASLFTCVVPSLATVLAIVVLGEWPGWNAALAVVVVTAGVLLVSGAVRLGPRPPRTGKRPAAPL